MAGNRAAYKKFIQKALHSAFSSEQADARNGEHADVGEQAKHPARNPARGGSGGSTLWRFGGFDVANVMV